jgi:hypothetical protein
LGGESGKTWRKYCPSALLSTTNLPMGCPELESGPRGDRPATSRQMHRTWSSGNQCLEMQFVLQRVRTVFTKTVGQFWMSKLCVLV